MATNGTSNGANGVNVSGWKHYNEGTFLFTVSRRSRCPAFTKDAMWLTAGAPISVRVCR